MTTKKKGKSAFKMPVPVKIIGRSSSITNSFVNGIIPLVQPTEDEINEALKILGMTQETVCCAYCGDKMTAWDHFRPLIIDQKPTGYISEIHNLVPVCNPCNSSKGNKNWRDWITSDASQSPKTRGVNNLEERIKRLEDFEKWEPHVKIDIEGIVGKEKWEQHWKNWEKILKEMHDSQTLSDEIRNIIRDSVGNDLGITKKGKVTSKSGKPCTGTKGGSSIADIAKTMFLSILQDPGFPKDTISKLTDAEYSKKEFNCNYPVLIELKKPGDEAKRFDSKGYSRYYSASILIQGKEYLLTSQWFERDREKLERWIIENREADID